MFPSVYGAKHQTIEVELTTIDELVAQFGAFDVWKLDVEGAEADALRGATRTLLVHPPRAIIAELYASFFDEFRDLAVRTHPFAYRAFIGRDSNTLILKDAGAEPDESVCHTSPMFVFTREPLSAAT